MPPEIKNFESGKKVSSFSLATNEQYHKKGETIQQTDWHNVVAWGKQAQLIEKYVDKGKEVAIRGKLNSRSYETETGEKKYVTEILASEILFLGTNENPKEQTIKTKRAFPSKVAPSFNY